MVQTRAQTDKKEKRPSYRKEDGVIGKGEEIEEADRRYSESRKKGKI